MTTRNQTANSPVAPVTPIAEPVVSDLDMLKHLMAKFSKADIVKLTKEVTENKATVLSVTMDAIVAAGDTLVSATINDEATRLGTDCGVFVNGDKASPVSTAQLIRHVQAYRSAVKRSEDAKAAETSEAEIPPVDTSAPSYVEGASA